MRGKYADYSRSMVPSSGVGLSSSGADTTKGRPEYTGAPTPATPVKNVATLLTDVRFSPAGGVEGASGKTAGIGNGQDGAGGWTDSRAEPCLPPCLPHGVADCPICLAEAEKIVDERLAASNPSNDPEVKRLRLVLERIAENAEDWHGPPPDMGHVRALKVISTWARAALAESNPSSRPRL